MKRQWKPLAWTLALSLLLHFAILFGIQIDMPVPLAQPELIVDIQAPPPPLTPPAAPKPRALPSTPHRTSLVQAPPTPALVLPPPLTEPVPDPIPAPLVKEPPVPTPAPPPISPPFPSRMELVFEVQRGEQGLVLGKTTHKWITGNNQYLLTSSTEATGLFALFFGGRYLITSRGSIDAQGLKPISFWIQRGQEGTRTEYAEFDWSGGTLDFGKFGERRSASIQDGAQDSLSVFYHLAMTAPHQGQFKLALTTGRKFNQYDYQVLGEETIETPLGRFKTQRLGKVAQDQDGGAADIWLAVDRQYLPVRFRLITHKGDVLNHILIEYRIP